VSIFGGDAKRDVTYMRFQVLTVANMKRRAFWDVITLMMEAVHTSETSVYSNEATWLYIPEGSHLQVSLMLHFL
jgi:hypothetical protein